MTDATRPVMTGERRDPRARRVLALYWVILIAGLALFTAARSDDPIAVSAVWVGSVIGTLLGNYLAVQRFRLWIAALIVGGLAIYVAPLVPSGETATQLALSFVPAALCGFWILGDRTALAAAWFPTVIWMIAILDRADRKTPDGSAAILLGGFAALFVALLAVRESRRIALWRSVAAQPLAIARPPELLREPPGRQLARAAWWLTVGGLTVVITVWLAPPLWRTEELAAAPVQIDAQPTAGLPCCPRHRAAEVQSTRVVEYLDLGLGHGPHTGHLEEDVDCRVCDAPAPAHGAIGWIASGGDHSGAPVATTGATVDVSGDVSIDASGGAGRAGGGRGGPPGPLGGGAGFGGGTSAIAPPEPAPELEPTRAPAPLPVPAREPTDLRVEPPAPVVAETPPEPAPILEPATEPADEPTDEPTEAPPQVGPIAPPSAHQRARSDGAGGSLMHWLMIGTIAAVVSQLVRLGLRPVRRLVTVRHLRRPFWRETIDQQVSNAWQLALVGLRDAGWRTGATEAPGELARRTGVAGLAPCAAILERARHGVGLDAGDLGEMQRSADTAYRAARGSAGGFARALGWLRWPLT